MPTLVLTINGPFAYVGNYSQTGDLTLMAPLCAQHLAGISSIEEDSQVILQNYNCRNHTSDLGDCKRHLYELRFQSGEVTPPTPPDIFLRCPWPPNGFDARRWRFWLTLPMPDAVVPVNPVYAQIIRPGQNQNQAPATFAVGARLLYKQWNGQPVTLWYCNEPVMDPNNRPVSFDFSDYLKIDDHACVEIEYSNPLRDDPEHEDAVDCFENLMSALGLPWSIYIPKRRPIGQLESSKLNDCKSAVAWVG